MTTDFIDRSIPAVRSALLVLLLLPSQSFAAPPVVVTNETLFAIEDGFTTIGPAQLEAVDPDTPSDQILFTVVYPLLWGQLWVGNSPGATIFTQADIDAGLLSYEHFGPEEGYPTIFAFSVSDGVEEVPGHIFEINILLIDDPPVLHTSNALQVDRDCAIARLSAGELRATDVDSGDRSVVFQFLDPPSHGDLLFNGIPLSFGDTFAQGDIDDGMITYSFHGGLETQDQVGLDFLDHPTGGFILEFQINSTPNAVFDTGVSPVAGLHIEAACPSPFNPVTTITFGAPPGSHAQLSVYDAIGRKITTLFEGPASAARQSVTWNASGVSSGTYHLRLSSGHGETSRKIVLLR